tara:strand:- start:74 stop:268 length:195 start_codon:yes stop_codon:yes gene_type:complete
LCHFHSDIGGNDAGIFAIRANQANFGGANTVVDAGAGVALRGRVMWFASDGAGPLVVNVQAVAE